MKELKIKIYDTKDKALEELVREQMAQINPHLPIILKHFSEVVWGKHTHNEDGEFIQTYPTIYFNIQFSRCLFFEDVLKEGRMFYLELSSVGSDEFDVALLEDSTYKAVACVGSSKTEKFKDWI